MSAPKKYTVSQWRNFFKSRGVDDEAISVYLKYIEPLLRKDLPIIFDREHLSLLLGREQKFLSAVLASPNSFYRFFEIKKRAGGTRNISAPYKSLLECQKWILKNILNKIKINDSAMGYVANKSIKDHADPHVGDKDVLVIDFKNFFPSIRIGRVIKFFSSLGYTKDVSLMLSKICCLDDCLAQGAATSPMLSNLICRRLDARLSTFAEAYDLQYTRYADDLCFSGKDIPERFFRLITKICSQEAFSLNDAKCRIYRKGNTNKIVTGLNISGERVTLPKKYIRELGLALYHIEKHGYISHISKKKIHAPGYLHQLLGKVNYWNFIDPENKSAIKYKKMLVELILTTP